MRGILNSFKLATAAATLAVLIGAAVAYLDLRTQRARPAAARLSRNPAARAAGHGDGGRYPAGLHPAAVADLRHHLDSARRLRRPLHPAGNAQRQCHLSPDRPRPGGGGRASPVRRGGTPCAASCCRWRGRGCWWPSCSSSSQLSASSAPPSCSTPAARRRSPSPSTASTTSASSKSSRRSPSSRLPSSWRLAGLVSWLSGSSRAVC